jgi:hypothetical protein
MEETFEQRTRTARLEQLGKRMVFDLREKRICQSCNEVIKPGTDRIEISELTYRGGMGIQSKHIIQQHHKVCWEEKKNVHVQ